MIAGNKYIRSDISGYARTGKSRTLRNLLLALVVAIAACSENSGDTTEGHAPSAADTTVAANPAAEPEIAPPAGRGDTIWQGMSNGYRITWTEHDVSAWAGDAGFTLRDVLQHQMRMAAEAAGDVDALTTCTAENSIKLLSLVGSIMSIERSEYISCPDAAHPGLTTWYESFSFANPDRRLALTHYFDEDDIYRALVADALVKKTLAGGGVTEIPATLTDLVRALAGISLECRYAFTEDLLTRFAFHHIEHGKVAVRLGLSHGAGACRGALTQIGILLPIPEVLAADLKKAEEHRQGFLMKDEKKIAGDRSTVMRLGEVQR